MSNNDKTLLNSFFKQAGIIIGCGLIGILLAGFFGNKHSEQKSHISSVEQSEEENNKTNENVVKSELQATESRDSNLASTLPPVDKEPKTYFYGLKQKDKSENDNSLVEVYFEKSLPTFNMDRVKNDVELYKISNANLESCSGDKKLNSRDLIVIDQFVLLGDGELVLADRDDLHESNISEVLPLKQRIDGLYYWEDLDSSDVVFHENKSDKYTIPSALSFNSQAKSKYLHGNYLFPVQVELRTKDRVTALQAGKQFYFDLSQSKLNPIEVQKVFKVLNILLAEQYLGENRNVFVNLGNFDLNKVILDTYNVEGSFPKYNLNLVVDSCPVNKAN